MEEKVPLNGKELPEDSPQEGQRAESLQFVTFYIADETFAAEMALVREIIRVPQTVQVPLTPHTLVGLANLRGTVLPVVSLRRAMGLPDAPQSEANRVLVVDAGIRAGFIVDRVSSVIDVEPQQIERGELAGLTDGRDLMAGIIKGVDGGPDVAMILDFQRLIKEELMMTQKREDPTQTGKSGYAMGSTDRVDSSTEADEVQLVSFDVEEQSYAIAVESVQEIVQVPEGIVKIPQSAHYLEGIVILRNRPLPVVSLRALLGMPPKEVDDKSRIVVVNTGKLVVGLLVDSVSEVLRVSASSVEPMPELIAEKNSLASISQICRTEEGMTCIIKAEELLNEQHMKEAMAAMEEVAEKEKLSVEEEEALDSEEEQLVVFRLHTEEFGVPIDVVQEIVRVPDELTHIPQAPEFVEGVINLRGTVLPVVDLRVKLGMDPQERTDRQRIMVFVMEGVRIGFIVDSVTEVLKVAKSHIEPAPQLSAEQTALLNQIANLYEEGRIIQLLEPAHIIEDFELMELSSMS